MNVTSKTGLLASKTKSLTRNKKKKTVNLAAVAVPAPIVLRPFADLYNPFPYGCSLLCNHPTDREARDILKKARETWAQENKNVILPEELQAIRESLAQIEDTKNPINLPEELFRRYTDTDSRPLTPAPTLASVKTKGSGSRRCVTPDPITTSVLQERKLLILDLRRSHSQEVISWQGCNDPPIISILQPPTPSISIESPSDFPECSSRKETPKRNSYSPKNSPKKVEKLELPKSIDKKLLEQLKVPETADEFSDGEEEVVKRRGKRRKKRGRDSSRGPLAVQASIDPETQVAAIGTEGHNRSARPSLVPTGSVTEQLESHQNGTTAQNTNQSNSYLEPKTLKHLQRELTYETVDLEFDKTKRIALEEAFKTLPVEKKVCAEMKEIQKELDLLPINAQLWLSLPRVFSRSSARFELPLHSCMLGVIKPLTYLREHVIVSNGRRLLYNLVFKRHRNHSQEERLMFNENIKVALGEMMGKPLTENQFASFRELVSWTESDKIDFQTWCGICALFERVYAKEFCPLLPGKDMDPCNQVEIADFESLQRRLKNVKADERLVKILYAVKDM